MEVCVEWTDHVLIPYGTRTCIYTSFPNIYDLISFPLEALGDVKGNLEQRTNNLRGPHNLPYNPTYGTEERHLEGAGGSLDNYAYSVL